MQLRRDHITKFNGEVTGNWDNWEGDIYLAADNFLFRC